MALRTCDFGIYRRWASVGFDAFLANGEVDFWKMRMMFVSFAKNNRIQILKKRVTNGFILDEKSNDILLSSLQGKVILPLKGYVLEIQAERE